MYTISKEYIFSASHQLNGLPEDHPCSRLHGHNYKVIITCAAEALFSVGFVRDYREIDKIAKPIIDRFDHQHLNRLMPADDNPSAENIAKYLFEELKPMIGELHSITVKETDKTSATYSPYLRW